MNRKQKRLVRQIISIARINDDLIDQHVDMFFQGVEYLRIRAGLPEPDKNFDMRLRENEVAIIKTAEELERICKNEEPTTEEDEPYRPRQREIF